MKDKKTRAERGYTDETPMVYVSHGKREGKKAECGHSVLSESQPTTNCELCWRYFFSLNAKLVYASFSFLNDGKQEEVRAARGTKFLKHFQRFVEYTQNLTPVQAEEAATIG